MFQIIRLSSERDQNLIGDIARAVHQSETLALSNQNRFLYLLPREHVEIYVCLQNQVPVAHAALFYNDELHYEDYRSATVGFYECVHDFSASKKLLDTLEKRAKEKGCNFLIGPMDGSTWSKYRFVAVNPHPFFTLEPYNPEYYPEQFETAGFHVIRSYETRILTHTPSESEIEQMRCFYEEEEGLLIRPFDFENFEAEMRQVYEIGVEIFKHNFLSTPVPLPDFLAMYVPLKDSLDLSLSLVAEHPKRGMIAFLLAYKEVRAGKNIAVLKTGAKLLSEDFKGISYYLFSLLSKKCFDESYDQVILALMDQKNLKALRHAEYGKLYREYFLYGKEIS